jgi:hypothetical protein
VQVVLVASNFIYPLAVVLKIDFIFDVRDDSFPPPQFFPKPF